MLEPPQTSASAPLVEDDDAVLPVGTQQVLCPSSGHGDITASKLPNILAMQFTDVTIAGENAHIS